ncbi:MAG TPA: SAM-dependent methyltransferase [Candidatus Limnocylindrales bacterium]|nr:SAM-dependent methyltransferase [Candidatus Limnocylindrales bacterium]
MEPGLRRVPPPDLDAVGSDPALVAKIRDEIAANGPITFARFMELALYDPDGGYYRASRAGPGRGGDFLTAPETHPLFGRAIARHVADVWRLLGSPAPFTIREFGAGGGALAATLLEGLAREVPGIDAVVRYRPVEVEGRRLDELRARLAAAGSPVADVPVETDPGERIVGIVIANEVLDALPTHRLVARGRGLREVFVGWGPDGSGEGFVDVEAEPSSPALAERLLVEGISLAEGQAAEVCLAVDGWVASAADGLERGELLLIDYGHPAEALYDPARRPRGTVLAYLRHVAHDAIYRAVGRQDLTAHVDVTAVERAAARAGLAHLATVTQGPFLAALGAGELLVELQSSGGAGTGVADPGVLQAYLEARAALVRMIDPAAMGAFRVMAFGRGLPPGALPRGLDVEGGRPGDSTEPHQTPPN